MVPVVSTEALTPEEKLVQVEEQIDELLDAVKQSIVLKARRVVPAVSSDPELMRDDYVLAKLLITAYFEYLCPFRPGSADLMAKLQKVELAL